jgi:hypothetical protein
MSALMVSLLRMHSELISSRRGSRAKSLAADDERGLLIELSRFTRACRAKLAFEEAAQHYTRALEWGTKSCHLTPSKQSALYLLRSSAHLSSGYKIGYHENWDMLCDLF